jgi:hypothetical protein
MIGRTDNWVGEGIYEKGGKEVKVRKGQRKQRKKLYSPSRLGVMRY